MSYYDVDAILTDGEKVPCQFELDVPYLGHLDNSNGLKPGSQLSLPSGSPKCSPSPPQVLAALKADPRAVALRDQSPHFYGVGVRMLDLFDEREVGAVLRRTFVVRGGDVGLHARKAEEVGMGGQGEEFLRGLDEWERKLFRRGHQGVKGAREWTDNVKRS
ncbi:DNA replication complex GINS protein PSF3 [Cladobotryum mycophilum]|uniref:DNA replication complex GINS protein PSF3 n=1 Tax=Cladobotryum mycophilum TaxID=491253 RepID=A0ABR0SAR5_9HYPO